MVPAISVEGLSDNGVVDGVIPLMINAYDKGNQKNSLLKVVKLRKVSRVGFGFCSLLFWHFIHHKF
jgi:hypothetical protein